MKPLGFGMMRLPLLDGNDQTAIDVAQVEQMVDQFLAEGFTYFDTAYMYHDFQSERIARKALVERHPRESFCLASKLPTMFLKEAEDMPRIFEEQLEKCGVTYFDYYLLHCLNVENYATVQRLDGFGFVQKMKAQGKIRKIGFSYHDDAALLDRILTEHPETEFVQLQLNYLDWDNHAVQARACHAVAVAHHVPIIVMEPVKGGTLANVPPRAQALLQSHAPDCSPASWAIRFAASQENVFMVLSGMSNRAQLSENLQTMSQFTPLTADETALVFQVRDIINGTITIPCTACRYCVDGCPQQIPIPEYFALFNAEQQEIEKPFTVQTSYYESLSQQHGKASACIACGQCMQHCPQHLEIPSFLQQIAKHFETA